MKLIIAVIRNERVEATKAALESIGIRGVTFLHVTGRGQQKGRVSARELGDCLNRSLRFGFTEKPRIDPESVTGEQVSDRIYSLGFLPKRMLAMITDNAEVNRVVQAIVSANQTGQHGDGRIFICPMVSAIRISTGEQGDRALT